ncbi:WecB/TagA/CpsF family glycosyltransferase [Sporolactobacillus laevolacticus]|uniref:WecB/TagA/CpsF family glycosyltransferase n=1 Tax=Sporolactobacillus laevolacticus TaxID=33018 RepID=UPI0025B4239D|nr:WecB/TagA/CpsF family glycosyltransferase [Sporolactobacillus laevolacticus]MDN3956551.1 WecB/TagA/CpsF family glycosyltransferase [Sporolactobacillus laevolacticus]
MSEKKQVGTIYMNDFHTKQEFTAVFNDSLADRKTINLYFLNDHGFNIAQKDRDYNAVLNRADFLLNDGIGIKLGAKLWGVNLQENLNGTDLIPLLLQICTENSLSVYLLGSTQEIARSASKKLKEQHPDLIIAGTHDGYFSSDSEVVSAINQSRADVLLVGMGMPLQEKFIDRNSKVLKPLVRIAVGGFIDFASGTKPRAPKIMRRLNLEWLFRMALEPRRMWKRNVVGHAQFFTKVIWLKWRHDR